MNTEKATVESITRSSNAIAWQSFSFEAVEGFAQIISQFFEQSKAKQNLYSKEYFKELSERKAEKSSFWYLITPRQKHLKPRLLQSKAFCFFKRNISRFKKFLQTKSPISFILAGNRNKIQFLLNSLFYPLRNLNFQY